MRPQSTGLHLLVSSAGTARLPYCELLLPPLYLQAPTYDIVLCFIFLSWASYRGGRAVSHLVDPTCSCRDRSVTLLLLCARASADLCLPISSYLLSPQVHVPLMFVEQAAFLRLQCQETQNCR